MRKSLFISLFACSLTFAYQAEVKKDTVTLTINEKEKTFKKGEKFQLKQGDMICFVNGDGRVVIKGDKYKKQLSKKSKSCKHLPNENGKPVNYTKAIKDSVVSMFAKSKEKSVDGVSRKAVETDTLTAPIALSKTAKYLAVENSTWGPLPITLELLDEKQNIIDQMMNEEDIFTSFILPKSMIKENYTIKVTNAFDEVLVNSKIHLETK